MANKKHINGIEICSLKSMELRIDSDLLVEERGAAQWTVYCSQHVL